MEQSNKQGCFKIDFLQLNIENNEVILLNIFWSCIIEFCFVFNLQKRLEEGFAKVYGFGDP